MKIKKINFIHTNKKTGVKVATSTFSYNKGKEPVVENEKEIYEKSMETLVSVLGLSERETKKIAADNRSIKSRGGLLEVYTTKGRFYF